MTKLNNSFKGMIFKILLSMLMISGLFASDKVASVKYYIYQLKHLNKSQIEIFKKTWYKAKEFNLAYTMCAIAFKESSFGVKMYNKNDGGRNSIGSYGVFHNLVDSVYDRFVQYKPKKHEYNKIMSIKLGLAKRLMDDYDFSFSQSLAELKFWENVAVMKYKSWDKWKYSIMCYNGGTYGYSKRYGEVYYKNIVNIIKAIKVVRNKYNLK